MIKLDNLHNGLSIYQDTEGFCFGTDAVLLAHFASRKKFSNAADLCCGNGIIPILLSKSNCCKRIFGIEILKNVVNMAKRSIEHNNLTDKIEIICADIKDIKNIDILKNAAFDLVTVNPPYYTQNSGLTAQGIRGIARTELNCTLTDVMSASQYLLKSGGRFCIIQKSERLIDIISFMKNYKIEPKRIQFVQQKTNTRPTLVLIEGIKDAKPNVIIEKPIIIQNQNGKETKQLKDIYGKDN